MAESVVTALGRVHLESHSADTTADDWIDHILEQQRPHKRAKQDSKSIKKELEQKYLTPRSNFSAEWLNDLQQ